MIQESVIKQINTLHSEIESIVKTGLQKAIQIGSLMSECKEQIKHGDFSKWVEDNFSFSIRTAQNYLKLYDNRERLTGANSLTQAYRLLKNETVSLLTWDSVFEILENHLQKIKAWQINEPVPDYDREQIDQFIKGQKENNPDLIAIETNLTKAQNLIAEIRLRTQQRIGLLQNDIESLSGVDKVRALWLMELLSVHPAITITPTSLNLPDDITKEQWQKVFDLLMASPYQTPSK
jgi:hypothetical protein